MNNRQKALRRIAQESEVLTLPEKPDPIPDKTVKKKPAKKVKKK